MDKTKQNVSIQMFKLTRRKSDDKIILLYWCIKLRGEHENGKRENRKN